MQQKSSIYIKNSILLAVSNLLSRISTKATQREADNILIATTTGIGDTLFSTPALRAIKESFPNSIITAIVTPLSRQLLLNNPFVDRFLVINDPINIINIISLSYKLIKRKFTTAIVFHASQRIIWPLCKIAGAYKTIGESFGTKTGMSQYLTKQINNPYRMHTIDRRLSLVNSIGAYTNNKKMDLFLTTYEKQFATTFISSNTLSEKQLLIGVHPGAKDSFKCWPSEYFISTINELAMKFNCHFFITGSSNEKPLVNIILDNTENSTFVNASIRKSAAIIQKLDLFITNDSGPMHIAFALSTPTIALFSPSDHIRTGPIMPSENIVVINKPVTCHPSDHKKTTKHQCFETNCTDRDCMRQILPSMVVNASSKILQKRTL